MQRFPVLVYIHGESYEWNSGNPYDGSVLASYAGLVVVTLNYRLGILGFLNANLAPRIKARVANYGLMDQIAALHWVQQNIVHFGGDPSNVTLLGHGTGAACIHFLMTSPTVVAGLFHRAILLSGSALSSWAIVEDPVSYAVRLARQVNCSIPEDLYRDHENIVDCLREVPLEDLMKADVNAPTYLSSWGPSVDGVVIKTDFQKEILTYLPHDVQSFAGNNNNMISNNNMKRSGDATLAAMANHAGGNRYDLLFGVVTSEALWRFSATDIQAGFEGERRDKIIRTYVRNAYTYHLSEIFFTVVNEYTDWERTVQHPINTRDATVAALSDAEFVAPLVQTGDLLSHKVVSNPGPSNTKSYFYVFDYQTKDGDYPQRMGTVHGEELPYVFGAPLVDGFSHFPRNYTKSEVGLSEAVIIYFSNFARTGNPNEHQKQENVLAGSKERNRFRSILWDEYDSVHQKYLEISMKPRMKNHFRAHQLSVWLRLIPELHRAGMEDVVARHNLFRNHNDADLYDGVVRPDPLSRGTSSAYYDTPGSGLGPSGTGDLYMGASGVLGGGTRRRGNDTLPGAVTTMDTLLTTCVTVVGSGGTNFQGQQSSHHLQNQSGNSTSDTLASLEAAGYAAYSTALSVTIAIGCSLLILNVLIFAGVYYQRDKTRLEVKTLQQQQQQQQQHHHQNRQNPPTNFDSIGKHRGHYHVGHSGSDSVIVDVEQDTSAIILQSTNSGSMGHMAQSPSHHTMNTLTKQHLSSSVLPNLLKAPPPSPSVLQQQQQQQLQQQQQQQMGQHIIMTENAMTLQKNMNVANNIANLQSQQCNVTSASPPNGSATLHLSVPRPPPPPRSKSPPESQPLLAGHHHPLHQGNTTVIKSNLRVPTAAMDEMRV
ncbi:neuroligin-4, X-linked [Anabrus simplex]|uniref:neuroligin-4, X-linked n=1 Tax=Anabrus simplex TaxID=316456 RepID=UPI0035A274A1